MSWTRRPEKRAFNIWIIWVEGFRGEREHAHRRCRGAFHLSRSPCPDRSGHIGSERVACSRIGYLQCHQSARAGGYGSGEDCRYGCCRYGMQVLSVPGPGAEIVSGPEGIAIAREFNDRMAQLISAEPERFSAFAHLPMRSASAAADELA